MYAIPSAQPSESCASAPLESAPLQTARFRMADIRRKHPSERRAAAVGELSAGPIGFAAIVERTLPKGDAIAMAEIAGIQGAKQAATLMPLCHPLALEFVEVRCVPIPERNAIRVYCETALHARTGVEMEALAGASAALLTLYDLTKPVEPALAIGGVRLLFKEGGKSGIWIHPDGMDEGERRHYRPRVAPRLDAVPTTVITLSDRAVGGVYQDRSGPVAEGRCARSAPWFATDSYPTASNRWRKPYAKKPKPEHGWYSARAGLVSDRATSRPRRWRKSQRAAYRGWASCSAAPAPRIRSCPGSVAQRRPWSATTC